MLLARQAAAARPLCRACLGRGPLAQRMLATARPILRQQRQQEPFALPGEQGVTRTPSRYRTNNMAAPRKPSKLRPGSLPGIISGRLDEWVDSSRVAVRLNDLGFEGEEGKTLLHHWADSVRDDLEAFDKDDENFLKNMNAIGWDAHSLILAYESGTFGHVFEAAFLRHFLQYGTVHGPERLQSHLRSILDVTDLSNMPKTFPGARSINRKFHLHMGPTNSGKTYNALKALAAAKTGVYAGPLRLLAHEVWERINVGSVGALEGRGRSCNLLTGEERRIVDPNAGIVSCTVEMLPLPGKDGEPWDVVVVDEIQMMGDGQRGGAWTNAVMGANAKEIHLCGDETTVGLLKSMISSFKGDTLEIHRYERLTPLRVADQSLDGDWNKVQPGDCIVTFSRNNVFAVKKQVEGTLGKKCAVVYGALPPETRAEQARDFNEDSGRAEILVASDAVGMGLNLKIGRIIFESMSKYDGKNDVPLSLSQIKQIAGRAGRFGQQRQEVDTAVDEAPAQGGVVTTLHGADLPLLRAMLPLPLPPITRATVEVPFDELRNLAPLLPSSTPFADLLQTFAALAKLPPYCVLSDMHDRSPLADVVEPYRNVLTLGETDVLCKAPVSNRDSRVVGIFSAMVGAYADNFLVKLEDAFKAEKGQNLLYILKTVEETLAALPPLPPHLGIFRSYLAPPITIASIPLLESLHKALVVYLWLSYRLELAFPDRELAAKYKARTEKVLEICLERMPGVRNKKSHERTKEADREQALYRRKYVDKHGLVKPDIQWVETEAAHRDQRQRRWGNVSVVK